jgi:hypothetical protein
LRHSFSNQFLLFYQCLTAENVHIWTLSKIDAAISLIDRECTCLKGLADCVRPDAPAVLVQAYNSRLKYLNEERDILLAMQKSLSEPINEVGCAPTFLFCPPH